MEIGMLNNDFKCHEIKREPLSAQKMNNFQPLISIIIPHYNRDKLLRKAIESILSQEFEDWECLIIDDHSTETVKSAIRSFLQEYNSEKIHFHERPTNRQKGANACRNFGIEQAKGKYVALLDSDDTWPQNYLNEAIKFANNTTGFDTSYSGSSIYRDSKRIIRLSRPISKNEGLFDFLLSPDVIAQTSSYFIRREVALDIKFDEHLKRHQDYDFFIRLGQRYRWSFNPTCRTFIDWSTINKRKTDFRSCITVYERHSGEFKNRGTRIGYLVSYLGMALRENADIKVIRFYQNELKKIRYQKKIGLIFMVNFPKLFRYYKKLTKAW